MQNSGGGNIRFPVSFCERGRMVEFANRVSAQLAHTTSTRAPAYATAPAAAAPVVAAPAPDVASRLRQLDELRNQGLITDSEHAGKRAEILGRI